MALSHNQTVAGALCLRLLYFLAPIVFLVGIVEMSWWRTGDIWSPEKVLARQRSYPTGEVVYGRAFFSQQFGVYKEAGLRLANPEVVIVGSSRVMQFRDFMFTPLSFFNAGGLLQNIYDLSRYAELVAQGTLPTPDILIVGVDPWWFTANRGITRSWIGQPDETKSLAGHVSAFQRAIKNGDVEHLIAGLTAALKTPGLGYDAVGGDAIRLGLGFRRDGSLQYPLTTLGDYIREPRFVDRDERPVLDRIRENTLQFTVPASFDNERALLLVSALEQLRDLGAEVYALFPPFASESYHALQSSPTLASWWTAYSVKLVLDLEVRGFTVLPVSPPEAYGLDDRYMLDGFHPSEVLCAQIVLSLWEAAAVGSSMRRVDRALVQQRVAGAELPIAFEVPDSVR